MSETGGSIGGRARSLPNGSFRPGPRSHFTFQWHVTARCDSDCSHCYMRDAEDHSPQLDGELDLADCMRVLDDMARFRRTHGLKGRINITGGDPLLKDGLLEIVRGARLRGFLVGILGNAKHLDIGTAGMLRDAGVFRYQLSIDGSRRTHDGIRGSGSFDDTLRAVGVLNDAGIPSVVMFTVSNTNKDELVDVIRLCADIDVSVFDFSRLVPIGRGEIGEMVPAGEYRRLLNGVGRVYSELHGKGCRTIFGRKEGLWRLVEHEDGVTLPGTDRTVVSGCSVGSRSLTVLADGTVYPCRRLPVAIGRVPDETISGIFHGSPVLDAMRQVTEMEKCGDCALLPYCRGCMAVAAAAAGDFRSPDPQCWGHVKGKRPAGKVGLDDFQFWKDRESRCSEGCTVCDEVCGACAEACASCTEVCPMEKK